MPTRRILISSVVAVVALLACSRGAYAQICAGSHLTYFVRDDKGVVLDAANKALTLGPVTGAGQRWTTNPEFSTNDQTPKAISSLRGKTAALEAFGMCYFKVPVKLQLTLKGQTMNLTFLTPQMGETADRNFYVDSLPFRPGTYEIELALDPKGDSLFYAATGWKKIKD